MGAPILLSLTMKHEIFKATAQNWNKNFSFNFPKIVKFWTKDSSLSEISPNPWKSFRNVHSAKILLVHYKSLS